MQQGQAAALLKTTWQSWWRCRTSASNAVLAAKTSHIPGSISKRGACRPEDAILPLYSVVMEHLEYLFTMYNCQMETFRKDGSRFFSEMHQKRNKGNRHCKYQLDKRKTLSPNARSKFRTDFCPERLWDLHKYLKLNWTRSSTTCSSRFCFEEEVELKTHRSSFQSTAFYDSVFVKLETQQLNSLWAMRRSFAWFCLIFKTKLYDGDNKQSNNQVPQQKSLQ